MTISYLVTLAIRGMAIRAADRILRAGTLPTSAYDALEAELAQHDVAQSYEQAIRTERAFGLQSFSEMPSSFMRWPDESDYLDLMAVELPAMSSPLAKDKADEQRISILASAGPLIKLTAPSTQAIQDSTTRKLTELRCLRILVALMRQDQQGQDNEPKLETLGLPAEAIEDPYSGGPLKVKKLAEGWLIYGIGPDQRDDGGRKLEQGGKDVGLGPQSPIAKAPDERGPE